MGKIKILDDHIANQIAAGEVVERPSSVVKELVENSIDAQSTRIDVTVEEGGLELIRVSDNGTGMESDDCELAFSRHATSKIASGKDLFQIRTLGFRGEALPSISAVAKLECTTSDRSDGLGRKIFIEGGTVQSFGEAAASRGTDIQVRELFFNTPARLKYMKTIQTELGHISDYMYRLALAHPGISFSLKHNGNLLFQTLGNGDLLGVIAAIYGTSTAKQMIAVQGEHPDYKLSGHVSRPEITRANRNAMTTIINGRYIRSYPLNLAIAGAFHTLLPINRHPIAVFHIEMDPVLVDVNVHPAKLEARFSKERELVHFVEQLVREALGRQVLIPQGSKPVPKRQLIQEQMALYRPDSGAAASEANGAAASTGTEGSGSGRTSPPFEATGPEPEWARSPEPGARQPHVSASSGTKELLSRDSLDHSSPDSDDARPEMTVHTNRQTPTVYPSDGGSFPTDRRPSNIVEKGVGISPEQRDGRSFGSNLSDSGRPFGSPRRESGRMTAEYQRASESPAAVKKYMESASPGQSGQAAELPAFPRLYPIGQMHGTYLLAQNENGLYLIDQHAAHERINYEYYYERFGRPADASQELLVPITLEFTPSDAEWLKGQLQLFEGVGVYMEHFGGSTFLIRAHPHWFPSGLEQSIVEEMAEWVLSEKKSVNLAKLREQSSVMCSCKASIKANQNLSMAEMEALLDRLGKCGNPYTCPHGRPIVVSFSTYDLEKMFKRVM